MQVQKLVDPIKFITNHHLGSIRNVLLGAGLCYAVKNERYTHLPVIFLVPSIYAGYNLYDNKDEVVKWLKNLKTEIKKL